MLALAGRSVQTTQIYEGTNQIQRMVIAALDVVRYGVRGDQPLDEDSRLASWLVSHPLTSMCAVEHDVPLTWTGRS
ncbi:MAG: hypothetical protein FD127_3067 [Acidimicrobiaceae bacterium]|nr:MAG: hypothetical protein FD127_3067 [Acidimicrobiaceae bacterium]